MAAGGLGPPRARSRACPTRPLPRTPQRLYRPAQRSSPSGSQRAARQGKARQMRRHLYNTVRKYALAGITGAALITPVAAGARTTPDIVVHKAAVVAQDLRSPDAAQPVTQQPLQTDLRSPHAAQPVTQQPLQTDLRSPDATVPVVTHVTATPSRFATNGDTNEFDFGSAAVGAGIALLIALACAGGMVAVNRRRTPAIG